MPADCFAGFWFVRRRKSRCRMPGETPSAKALMPIRPKISWPRWRKLDGSGWRPAGRLGVLGVQRIDGRSTQSFLVLRMQKVQKVQEASDCLNFLHFVHFLQRQVPLWFFLATGLIGAPDGPPDSWRGGGT